MIIAGHVCVLLVSTQLLLSVKCLDTEIVSD